jgi:hypothetical protein
MTTNELFLIVVTIQSFFCMGASWMLQIVCYPTYLLVGEKEFVPFHVDFGKRLIGVVVVPMVVTCIFSFILLVVAPPNAPMIILLGVALCSAIILITTIFLEVPKHMKLDKDGKSDVLIHGLVRDNLPRTACWTIASFLLAYALVVTL